MAKFIKTNYDKIAQSYADAYFYDTTDLPLVNLLLDKLDTGARVLDIGCGPGQFAMYLAGKGIKVTGIDISDEMLAIAKRKVPVVTFTKMDMRKLEFPDNTFDGILAAYSIIDIPNSELPAILVEIKRVLKPGGHALFIAQEGEPDQVLDEPLMKGEKIFINFFTKERIAEFTSKAGFELVQQKNIQLKSEVELSATSIGTLVKQS